MTVEALLGEYAPRVYRFALRLTQDPHEAEDLTQDTMLKAWRARRQLRTAAAAKVWLLQIAVNLWRDRLRQRRRRLRLVGAVGEEQEAADASPDREVAAHEELRRALTAMDALPDRQREVLYLHACEGLCLAEIAEVLQITPQAVKASLSLARKKMRQQLEDSWRKAEG
jgi:RNA polymerase sigma-70 factor (ECF subfamily)